MSVRTYEGRRAWWVRAGEELESRLRAMAYADTDKRDLRLDFLRGLAVAVMVVDHIGGDSLLTQLSGANQFIVSAAEGFVFLSGLIVGMVYGERLRRRGLQEASTGLLRRAFTLYKASVGIALAFVALFLFTGLRLWFNRDAGLGVNDPVEAVVGILTLHYSYHGSDVLVMYTLMVLVAPGILYMLYKGRTALTLAGSVIVWGLYQRYPAQAGIPWSVAESQFPVAAWQFLFVLGMVAGYHRKHLSDWILAGRLPSRLAIFAMGGSLYLLAWTHQAFGAVPLPHAFFGDTTYASLFVKASLGPGRILAFLGLAVMAYVIATAMWAPLNRLLGWFLVPLGQSSLYVYIMHIFVLVTLYNLALLGDLGLGQHFDLAFQMAGLIVLWLMVRGRFLFYLVPR